MTTSRKIGLLVILVGCIHLPALAQYDQPQEEPVVEEPASEYQEDEVHGVMYDTDSLESKQNSNMEEQSLANQEQEAPQPGSSTPTGSQSSVKEDEESTSESVISFNFLYFLLQKFRFSDSLR